VFFSCLLQVEGLDIVVENIIGSTGLELKADPGVPLVYAGFGALMITTLVSYVSHSQVRREYFFDSQHVARDDKAVVDRLEAYRSKGGVGLVH
jgi:cytochrome c biogenesis protein ResB